MPSWRGGRATILGKRLNDPAPVVYLLEASQLCLWPCDFACSGSRGNDTDLSCCGSRHTVPTKPGDYAEETRRVPMRLSKSTLCLRIAVALGPIYQDRQFAPPFPRSWPAYRSAGPACVGGHVVAYKETVLSTGQQMPRGAGSMGSPRSV